MSAERSAAEGPRPRVSWAAEWRLLSRETGFRAGVGLLLALACFAGWSGVRAQRAQQDALLQAQAEERARIGALREELRALEAAASPPRARSDPRDAGWVGRFQGGQNALQPPAPLAALTLGQSDLEPARYSVTARPASSFLADAELANPMHLLSGPFDLAFVVVFLVPLCVLALGYDLISGERERGTLALLRAQPLPAQRVLLARMTLRVAAVAACIALAGLGTALLSGAALSLDGALRLVLWTATGALYAALWGAIALGIGALGRSPATHALGCAGAWLTAVLLVPGLVSAALSARHPLPSRLELIHTMREASEVAGSDRAGVLARYFEEHPELSPEGVAQPQRATASYVAAQESVEAAVTPILERFERRKRERQDLAASLSLLSPALLAQRALAEAAGTGESRHRRFLDQVHAFHAQWRAFFLPRIFQERALTDADYDAWPRFRYVPETPSAGLARAALPLAALAAITALVLALALRLANRALGTARPAGRGAATSSGPAPTAASSA